MDIISMLETVCDDCWNNNSSRMYEYCPCSYIMTYGDDLEILNNQCIQTGCLITNICVKPCESIGDQL